jgi:hypothetical protein
MFIMLLLQNKLLNLPLICVSAKIKLATTFYDWLWIPLWNYKHERKNNKIICTSRPRLRYRKFYFVGALLVLLGCALILIF